MTDIEQELSALLRERASDVESAPVVGPPADKLRRHVRLRQARTVLISAVVLASVVLASGVGIEALLHRPGRPRPGGSTNGNVLTTSISTGGITMSAPKGWWFQSLWASGARYVGKTDLGRPQSVLPILQVTSFDPRNGPFCPDRP